MVPGAESSSDLNTLNFRLNCLLRHRRYHREYHHGGLMVWFGSQLRSDARPCFYRLVQSARGSSVIRARSSPWRHCRSTSPISSAKASPGTARTRGCSTPGPTSPTPGRSPSAARTTAITSGSRVRLERARHLCDLSDLAYLYLDLFNQMNLKKPLPVTQPEFVGH